MTDTQWTQFTGVYPRPPFNPASQPEDNLVPAVIDLREQTQDLDARVIALVEVQAYLPTTVAPTTVANLPSATGLAENTRGFVTDADLAYVGANIGTTVNGGGSFSSPVVIVAGAWVIG